MLDFTLTNKNIVVVGMGLTGLSCVRFLLGKGAQVIAMDSRTDLSVPIDVPLLLGDFDLQRLSDADMIVLSPGVSPKSTNILKAKQSGVPVLGDIELFAHFNELPVIAITGSNGKSTVTQLVQNMCQAGGKKSLMGGNIGLPALDLLEQEGDIVVLELSSFQLESTYSLRPLVSTVLNVSADHLDRHGDISTYQQAKLGIYLGATFTLCNRDDPLTYPADGEAQHTFGLSNSALGFSWDPSSAAILYDSTPFIHSQDCMLVGAHNMLNIQAAAALAMLAGIDLLSIKGAAMAFTGLPHRCQTVSMLNNVRWINDSKATNVGATVAAIEGLASRCDGKLLLIAGGEGKGADFTPLQASLASVAVLITLGTDGPLIAQLMSNSIAVTSLEQAVQVAHAYAEPNDIVLLSPACASFDMFANYQQRGERFVQAVKALAA
jgi:UDP-N-acetylmuramoylalanine--D-glutamate ligase